MDSLSNITPPLLNHRNVVITFVVTALYDVVLQLFIHNKIPDILGLKKTDWLRTLPPYFEQHTPLAAALIAGFVGAVTQPIILKIASDGDVVKFLATTFLVSGLVGFAMKATGLFPVLSQTYYKELGPSRAFVTDAYSGLVVNITVLLLRHFKIV